MPLISVIITTYERSPEMLQRAINSVLNQTYNNYELIIVDDSRSGYCMRDDVMGMVKRFNDTRITYIRHEKNMGACQARNTGIRAAKGEYIALLDDDDEWLPTKLEKQLSLFNEETGIVSCRWNVIEENKSEIKVLPGKEKIYSGKVFDKLMLWGNFIGSNSCPLIKKACFDKVGTYNPGIKANQDLEMWLRITKEFAFRYVEEPLVNYYVHSGERITTNYNSKIQGNCMINDIYSDYLQKNRRARCVRLSVLLPYYKAAGMRKNMLQTAWKVFLIKPFWIRRNIGNLLILLGRKMV